MLTIVCGEDIVTARHKFQNLINTHKGSGAAIELIANSEIENLLTSAEGVSNLFGEQLIYVTEFISKKYKGRAKTQAKEAIQKISVNNNIHLISWEGGLSAHDLSSLKKIATKFYESKPPQSIFDLMDACYPKNLSSFLNKLDAVYEINDQFFIYTMLRTHIRKIYLISEGIPDTSSHPYVRAKNTKIATKWQKDSLRSFYEKLLNIDPAIRTGETFYSYLDSIKLLVCYYLK